MKTLAIPNTEYGEDAIDDRQIRDFVRYWIGLLAEQKYDEAIDLLLPEIPRASRSIRSNEAAEWTPELLEAVVANYGTPEPQEGQDQLYKVVPMDDLLLEEFRSNLDVDLCPSGTLGKNYLGDMHAHLPLNYKNGNAVGSLVAKFFFQRVSKDEMALVLVDIHTL